MDSREVLQKRISLLRSKIKTTLAAAHQEEDISMKLSALQKNILKNLTHVMICVDKI